MSIQIEVPIEALSRPGVAEALAELMTSLGGHRGAHAASAAPAKRSGNGRRKEAKALATAAMAGVEAAAPATKRGPGRPRKANVPNKTSLKKLPTDERWEQYVASLPDASRNFLRLLEERGELTVGEAVKILELATPKAMGGLTGAMARWAPKQGVKLPYEAKKHEDGTRYWIWTRAAPHVG